MWLLPGPQSMSTNNMATVSRLARSSGAVEAKPAVSIQLRLVYLMSGIGIPDYQYFLALVGLHSSSTSGGATGPFANLRPFVRGRPRVPKHPDLAFALEGAMASYLLSGFSYDQLNGNWLCTILTLNMALHLLAKQNSDSAGVVRSFRPRISAPGRPHPRPAASPPTPVR